MGFGFSAGDSKKNTPQGDFFNPNQPSANQDLLANFAKNIMGQQIKALSSTPQLGAYQGATGSVSGQLLDQYKLKDPGAVRSPWMDQMLQQQNLLQTQALNQGAKRAASGAAQAQAALARRGGLSSGAAERLQQSAQENAALGAQDIYSQGAAQRLGMQTQDMQNERQYQTGLQQANIQTLLADLAAKQGFNLKKYEEEMKGYGADKSAAATEKAGGGGGLTVICTALRDVGLVTPETREKASKFRFKVTREMYEAYLIWGTPVANAIRKVPALGYLFRPFVRYLSGDRDLLAKAQYKVLFNFTKLFVRKNHAVQIRRAA